MAENPELVDALDKGKLEGWTWFLVRPPTIGVRRFIISKIRDETKKYINTSGTDILLVPSSTTAIIFPSKLIFDPSREACVARNLHGTLVHVAKADYVLSPDVCPFLISELGDVNWEDMWPRDGHERSVCSQNTPPMLVDLFKKGGLLAWQWFIVQPPTIGERRFTISKCSDVRGEYQVPPDMQVFLIPFNRTGILFPETIALKREIKTHISDPRFEVVVHVAEDYHLTQEQCPFTTFQTGKMAWGEMWRKDTSEASVSTQPQE